jgi:phosphonate transport system permease protein
VSTVIPQFIPSFISTSFYLLDVYFRSSTILGIVGGGGIGYLLIQSIRVYQFDVTATIVISVFLIVLVIEWVGNWVRGLYR